MDDMSCPWCGEVLRDPFTNRDVTLKTYDRALEAHVMGCADYLEEAGA